jgi:hypothetical protein
MVGALHTEDVAHVLDDDVLEAASGPDERHASLARETDHVEGRVGVAIGACGRDPDAVVRNRRFRVQALRPEPVECETGVLERRVGGDMRLVLGLVVADDGDAGANHPVSIPPRRVSRQ